MMEIANIKEVYNEKVWYIVLCLCLFAIKYS